MSPMLLRVLLLSALLAGSPTVSFAQHRDSVSRGTVSSDSLAVISAVHAYIRALEARDTAHIRRASLPTHTSIAVPDPQGPDGEPAVRTLEQLIAGLARETRKYEGRVWNERVMVHGGTALYVAPYESRYDGVLTSCGVDQYIMVRVRGAWRVSQLLYTRKVQGC